MKLGENIYQAVCAAPNLEQAVAALPLSSWRILYGYLGQNYDINGVSGLVLGIMTVNGAERLAAGRKG